MKIEVRGRTVGYEDSGGGGVPLLLLHGFPLDRTVWTAQVLGLAGAARVLAPDLRGFGESAPAGNSAPGTTTSMDDYAEDVAALLDALGVPAAVVCGLSMGGYVAMAFHRAFPARLRGMILVDTRGGPDSPEGRKARDAAGALGRERGAPAVAEGMLGKMLTSANVRTGAAMGASLLRMMCDQPVVGIVGALEAIRDRPDSLPSLARVDVPTLVVCGAEDALIHPSESKVLRDAIPGARLTLIRGAGHLPNYERPGEFNRLVEEFLAGIVRQDPAPARR